MRKTLVWATAGLALTLVSATASADHRHYRKTQAFYHHAKYHHYRSHDRHYYPRWNRKHHHTYLGFYLGPSLYYYADHHYYRRHPRTREYIVIDKPAGADRALQVAAAEELYVYPREGQTAEQQDRDRYDCHIWATEQTGVDLSLQDVGAEQVLDYRRASSACLEGRGYTVK